MVRFCARIEREDFDESDVEFVEDKIANSATGISYRGSYAWILAGLGQTERAREELRTAMTLPHPFDANWLSFQTECAEAAVLTDDATYAATLYARLTPYAGRPATAGRAVVSYGAIDRHLGGLAEVLGRKRRRDPPPRERHSPQRRARLHRLAHPRRAPSVRESPPTTLRELILPFRGRGWPGSSRRHAGARRQGGPGPTEVRTRSGWAAPGRSVAR